MIIIIIKVIVFLWRCCCYFIVIFAVIYYFLNGRVKGFLRTFVFDGRPPHILYYYNRIIAIAHAFLYYLRLSLPVSIVNLGFIWGRGSNIFQNNRCKFIKKKKMFFINYIMNIRINRSVYDHKIII